MRVKMVVANLTTVAKLDDRKGAVATVSSDDDDDVDPIEDRVKSVTTHKFEDAGVLDSDDDSLSSNDSKSLETKTGKAQDSTSDDDSDGEGTALGTSAVSILSTIRNPSFEGLTRKIDRNVKKTDLGKQMDISVQKEKGVLGKGENDELMAAAQAAAIPSDDSFSDDSEDNAIQDDRSRLMAAALAASMPSDDSFSDDGTERTKLMAAAQAASIPSDTSFSENSESGKLMDAAQAASIPSDDSFRDIEARASTMSEQVTTRVLHTGYARFRLDSEDPESDDSASSFLTVGSERTSTADESEINMKVLSDATGISVTDYSPRISSRNSVEAGDDGGSEESDQSGGDDWKKSKKIDREKVSSSRSFSGISTSFNWSTVKTKIFYSFKALKASAGSSSDGSRTVFVKNLAKDVTDNRLSQFFQDSGTILDIRIIRDPHSGLGSAYVEFESGNSARKALRKSGKKLEGRVILCDIAYENSKGARSLPDSGHGTGERRSELFESSSTSTHSRVLETQAALKLFDPELREGDAKFLSRFSDDPFTSYSEMQSSLCLPERVSSHSSQASGSQNLEPSKGLPVLGSWHDPYEDSLILGKTEAELEQSVYFDAENLSRQSSVAMYRQITVPRKSKKSRKRRLMRFFWPWKSLRCQWWQIATESSTWTARPKTSTPRRRKAIDTKQKSSSQDSVKRPKAIDSQSNTSQESVKQSDGSSESKHKTSQESVKLFC